MRNNFTAMKCKVKAFGITREIIRTRELEVMLPAGATVAELKNHLFTGYPPLSSLTSLYIAVNAEYAPDDRMLADGDEIALIPPVSGG
jgi:molybdopterin converting factor subunit 1